MAGFNCEGSLWPSRIPSENFKGEGVRLFAPSWDMNLSELLHSILLPVRIPVIQVSSPAEVFFARADKVCVILLGCILNIFCAADRTANASFIASQAVEDRYP